jgi:hypothetical protein
MVARRKGEHVKYVVVTYREVATSKEMTYFEAEQLKEKLDEENELEFHEIEDIIVPLKEEKKKKAEILNYNL